MNEVITRDNVTIRVTAVVYFSLQLRFLQTLTEIAVAKNSTIIFSLPVDILEPIMETMRHYANMPDHEPLNGSRRNEPSLPR